MAPGFMEPALGLHAVRVREHPHPIEVAFEVVDEIGRWLGQLAAESELFDGPGTAVRTDDGQHQRVPVEP